jgi:hypothetical protein
MRTTRWRRQPVASPVIFDAQYCSTIPGTVVPGTTWSIQLYPYWYSEYRKHPKRQYLVPGTVVPDCLIVEVTVPDLFDFVRSCSKRSKIFLRANDPVPSCVFRNVQA